MMPRGGPRGAMPGNFRQGGMYPSMPPYGMPNMQMGPGGQVKQGQMRPGQQPGMPGQAGRGQGPRGQPGMQQMQAGGRVGVKFNGQARNQPNAASAPSTNTPSAPPAGAAQQAAPPSASGGLDLDSFAKLE